MPDPFYTVGADRAVLRERRIVIQNDEGRDIILIGKQDDGRWGIVCLDRDGIARVRLGQLTPADGVSIAEGGDPADAVYGFEVLSRLASDANWPDAYFPIMRGSDQGMEYPYAESPWTGVTADPPITVTSASFVDTGLWATRGIVMHRFISSLVWVQTAVGTTAEIRLSVDGAHSDVVAVGSGANTYASIDSWEHPTPLLTGPQTVILQARRVSGAGNVTIQRQPYPVVWRPF